MATIFIISENVINMKYKMLHLSKYWVIKLRSHEAD